jgi:hypothetical protein
MAPAACRSQERGMTAPDPIAEKIEREDRERTDRQRAAWDKLFAEWLTNRATYIDPNVTFENDIDRELAHADRESELARLITTTPAVFPWMIMCKIEVLEHYLGASDGAVWADKCEVVMLAGIKADLLRFEPKADNP